MTACGRIDLAEAFAQSARVDWPDLIENNLPGFSSESNRCSGGVRCLKRQKRLSSGLNAPQPTSAMLATREMGHILIFTPRMVRIPRL
jgi:hypothetical protein